MPGEQQSLRRVACASKLPFDLAQNVEATRRLEVDEAGVGGLERLVRIALLDKTSDRIRFTGHRCLGHYPWK
ncbi:MAG: hypothetical protein RLY70_185, partial [Planctomycetota bacterium]